jgi:luciferase family oxidoreductase group 1
MRLSILDQSPVRTGSTAAAAVQETLELAEAAERLGYHRYWLAEHHATAGLAGTCPEVLIPAVAARTSRIRVGSGGVMLQHYSSLKVAESFRVLETLFPGRIDLGIGRAPGSDQLTARALRDDGSPDYFPQQVSDLVGFLHGALPEGHVYSKVLAMPTGPTAPEMWLLGSSDASAAVAAHFGTGFSFAHFINQDGGAEVTRAYRRQFRPSEWLDTPRSSAAVFVVCADTEAEAQRLAKSRQLFIVRLYTGRAGRYPSIEEAETYPYSERELAILHHAQQRTIAGNPEQVRERLEALAADYEADELIVVTITHDPKARRRSYELLAKAFGLDEATA